MKTEDVEIINNIDKCPNINVKIQGVKTEALIDTGSEITCISENFFENNKNKFKNCKILPIVGTSVVGATGVKPIKLKHQLYADLDVNNETYSCIFIVIPKLNKNCILGIDMLKKFKGRINIEEKYIMLRSEDNELKIKFIQCSLFILALGHSFSLKINVQGNISKILRGRKYIVGMKKANVSATNRGPLQCQI